MNIDIRTLAIVLILTSSLESLAIFVQYRIDKAYRGIGWWALGFAALAAGPLCLLLRDVAALERLSIIVANGLLALGSVFIYIGIMQFLGRPGSRGFLALALACSALSFVYFTYARDDTAARTVIVAVTEAAILFLSARDLFIHKTPAIAVSARFSTAVLLVYGCFFALRAVVTVTVAPTHHFLTPTLQQITVFLAQIIFGILITFALIIMVNQRLSAEYREAQLKTEQFFNTNPDSVMITRMADGAIVAVNDGFTVLLGYARAEAIGRTTLETNIWTNPADRQRVVAALNETGYCENLEAVFQRQDGSQFTGIISARPIVLQGVPHVVSVTRDITERKQIEENLRAGEARMRAITSSAQDAIIMLDPDGRISFWNPAAERIFGYTADEVLGRPAHALLAPQRYHDRHYAAFAGFQLTGQGNAVDRTLELEARHKQGHEISAEMSLSALHLQAGWHSVGIVRDVTARKRTEEALRDTNRNLEAATARANDMASRAERANAAKGEFLANMSHEIRTPMNGIIGMIGLLLDTELDADQRRYADTARASGESLLALLNDILDFSKIEAGKLDLETLDFDLHALLDDFADLMALRAQAKGLEFICAAAPGVPDRLRGDPGRLRQILNNLAGNSVKFTHQGEIAVRVSLVSETGAQVVLRFSIKDTGIGIPADKQKILFQKFAQVDSSTTRQYGGSGLGLAISKELAGKMGGEIGVVSEEGHGSEFWFTVCLSKQAEPDRPALPPADIRGARILIVDDNATNRDVLLAQLVAWGVRPGEATDGPAALQALRQARASGDPFQAAILDMQMPGMDGVMLARAIKADKALKDTRLMLLTSVGQRGDARQMEEIGFAAYLTKPTRQSDLFDCLVTMLTDIARPERPIVTRHVIHELRRGLPRVLLAEDNITNQQVVLGVLKKLGLRADAVANGLEAVKALEIVSYGLVLMDVQMPEMDGLEATRIIRNPQSAVSNHQIPIIAMTALAMPGDRERCLAAGMNDYLTKPLSIQALADVLERWLPGEAEGVRPSDTGDRPAPSPPARDATTVFDRAGVMARLMNDEELVQTVIEGFVEDIPNQLEMLHNCLAAGDVPGVILRAHTIKGTAANVGGEVLRAAAAEMEKAARAGQLDAARAMMAGLAGRADQLKQAMEQAVGEGRGAA